MPPAEEKKLTKSRSRFLYVGSKVYDIPELRSPSSRSPSSTLPRRSNLEAPVVEVEGQQVTLSMHDYSEKGLTTVPDEALQRVDTGIIILSTNNIRALNARFVNAFQYLHELYIDKNSLKCPSPTDYSCMAQEMTKLAYLNTLSVQECNLQYIPPVVFQLTNLQRLSLNRNKIYTLPAEIGQLRKLQYLNLQFCGLKTLPPEIALCQLLQTIVLHGNNIETLPETFSELRKLRQLDINFHNFAVLIDEYMRDLLKTGQIESEHIPFVIFELRSLRELDFEDCELNIFPTNELRSIKQLQLSKNFFKTFPREVLQMKTLDTLNLSRNDLCDIPEDIKNLTKLRSINLSHNNLTSFPSGLLNLERLWDINLANNEITEIPEDIELLHELKHLNMSWNKLDNLPDSICNLFHLITLDLSNNAIQSLPLDMYKLSGIEKLYSYDKLQKSGLWLHKNPETNEASAMWKTTEVNRLFEYLRKLSIRRLEHVEPCRLVFIGDAGVGKTQLLANIFQGTSIQLHIKNSQKSEPLPMNTYTTKTKNGLKLKIYDLNGDPDYRPLYYLYLTRALFILVYKHEEIEEKVGEIKKWLNLITEYAPGSTVKIVGTHCDDNDTEKYEETEDFALFHDSIDEFTQQRERQQEKLFEELEQMETIDSALKTEANHFMMDRIEKTFKKNIINIAPSLTLVGKNTSFIVFEDLHWELELLIANKQLFPHVHEIVPPNWTKFKSLLGKRHPKALVMWPDIEALANECDVENSEEMLGHFELTGEIMLFSEGEWVITRTQVMNFLLTTFWSSDWKGNMNYRNSKLYKCRGLK